MVRGRLHNRIDLLVAGRREESIANAAVRPGEALAVDADGKVGPHATANVLYECLIALHDQKQGKTVDDAYVEGDLVSYCRVLPGDIVNLLVEGASALTLDDFMTVTGTGTWDVATSTDTRMFRCLEIIEGTGSADMLIKCVKL